MFQAFLLQLQRKLVEEVLMKAVILGFTAKF